MAAVDFYSSVGGDDVIISDDDNPTTGLANGGHRTRFIIALQQLVKVAQFVVARAQEASLFASSALNAPGTKSTSTTSFTIGTGEKTFQTQMNKSWSTSQTMVAGSRANAANYMIGLVKSYNATTGALVLIITSVGGSGTFADWDLSLTSSSDGAIPLTRKFTGAGLASVSGDGSLAADRTITVPAATATQVRAMTSAGVAVTPQALGQAAAFGVLPDNGSSVTWDMQIRPNGSVTLTGGNRALATPDNPVEGWTYVLKVVQGDSGGRALTFAAAYDFGFAGVPSFSVGAGKVDIITAICIDATPGAPIFRCAFSRGS